MAVPGVFHVEGTVFGAGRIAIGFNRIKSGIAEEGIRSERGVE